MHTPNFEVSSFSRSRDIGSIYYKFGHRIRPLVGFDNSIAFFKATEYHFVKFEGSLCTCGWVNIYNRFSSCRTLGAPIEQIDLRVGGPIAARGLRQMKA